MAEKRADIFAHWSSHAGHSRWCQGRVVWRPCAYFPACRYHHRRSANSAHHAVESSHVKDIEKAITIASLGVSVVVDDKGLRINVPELTAERRTAIVKMAKEKARRGQEDCPFGA